MNIQPDETDLGVCQCVDISRITLEQHAQHKLDIVLIQNGSLRAVEALTRGEVKDLVAALCRWLDTGGFYAPDDGLCNADDIREMINDVNER